MAKQNSDNLSKGDIISFVALLLLGVTVFFGMNFKTLGDKVPSIVVAILLVVVMTVFVFLAAHAKAQNRNQAMWKNVEYAMLGLYVVALIPCYLYAAKFFDVQFAKSEIMTQVQKDVDGIDKMFADYKRKCDSRCGSYQTALEVMSKDSQGKERIAKLLDITAANVTQANIKQASESFLSSLKGGQYKALEAEKNNLVTNVQTNFKNWNILFIPQYASELNTAKDKYATELQNIYTKHKNNFETNIPEFDASSYITESTLADTFSETASFSIIGLIAVLILGGLGLVKYLLGEKRTVIDFKKGDSSVITSDGGFTF